MAISSVGIDDYGIGGIQHTFIADPAVWMDGDFKSWDACEAFLEQETAGIEFMHPRRMARFTGDQDELFRRALLSSEGNERPGGGDRKGSSEEASARGFGF